MRKDTLIVIFSVVIILIATLYPFNFSLPSSFSLQNLLIQFESNSNFVDKVNNILLFIPLGFSFTKLLQRTRKQVFYKIFIVFFVSSGLSFFVEVLQLFVPSREPSIADIINNTISGLVGLLCFYLCNSQKIANTFTRIENSSVSRSFHKITLCFIGYILLTFIILIPWFSTLSLSDWNLDYPLLLGNERTGDRAWQGYISDVYIADKAISSKEISQVFANKSYLNNLGKSLLAHYEFNEKCCYEDRTGKLPRLLWRRRWGKEFLTTLDTQERNSVFLSPSYWLETETPVTVLNKRIRETSEFTISTTVSSSNINQTGPARIISLSNNPIRRNFTLGQQRTDLDLRVRTPITGANGSDLNIRIPRVFADSKTHHIVITYSKATLQVYIDKIHNFYSFNLLELIPKEQKLFYYALTFVPIGICLTLLITLVKKRLLLYRLLLFIGILLPSLILEGILVSESGKSVSLTNLLLSVFFTTGTMLLLRVQASYGSQDSRLL